MAAYAVAVRCRRAPQHMAFLQVGHYTMVRQISVGRLSAASGWCPSRSVAARSRSFQDRIVIAARYYLPSQYKPHTQASTSARHHPREENFPCALGPTANAVLQISSLAG
jgi:hypothetical protein